MSPAQTWRRELPAPPHLVLPHERLHVLPKVPVLLPQRPLLPLGRPELAQRPRQLRAEGGRLGRQVAAARVGGGDAALGGGQGAGLCVRRVCLTCLVFVQGAFSV